MMTIQDETEELHDDVANDDDYGYVSHSATFTPSQTLDLTLSQWRGLPLVGQD